MSREPVAPITTNDGVEAVKEFFGRMGYYCAARNFDATESLFAPDVASFGTKATVVEGLEHLRKNQWEKIWPNIEGFRMLTDEVRASAEGSLAWGMVPWMSTGFHENGTPYERPGRATAVLACRDGIWLCIHTHFSLAPGTPQQSFANASKESSASTLDKYGDRR